MPVSNLFKKLRPRGLRSQLILGIASILALLMSLLVIKLMDRQKNFLLKLNHDRAFALSTNLSSTASSYVTSYELAGLQKLVSTYKNNPGLQYAIVTSDDGIVLAHTSEKYRGLKAIDSVSAKLKPVNATQTLIENNSILDIATPIIDHDKIVGWARIGLSQEYIASNLKAIRRDGLLFILMSVVVGAIFSVIVSGRLSKGLQKLLTAALKIKAGNRTLRVDPSGSIEITELGIAFNQMLDDISSNERLMSMVLENMPVGVWILDEKGNVVSGNSAGREMWKGIKYVGMDEFNVYKGWFTKTGIEVQSHEWGAAIALREDRPVLEQEIEIECFDGSHKIILNSAIPLRDANKKLIGAIAINLDITDRKNAEDTLHKINNAVGERVKELDCLYGMSELSNDSHKTTEQILQDCADLIPAAYQYAEITCARIVFNGQIFESAGFQESRWKQEANIIIKNNIAGRVEVFYKEQMKEEAEGPFLEEERLLLNSIVDILGSSTERKNAEAIIKEQAETFTAIIENANESILLLSPDLKILQFNKTARDRIRLNGGREVYIGANFREFLYPGTENVFTIMFNDAVAGKYAEQELCQTNIHGETFWIRTKMYPVYDTREKLIGITLLAENITDRKKVENELKDSEEKFRSLVEDTLVGVFILQDEKIVYANPGFENICGYTRQELLDGMNFQQLIYKEDVNWAKQNYELRISGEKPSDEYLLRSTRKDGAIIYVDVIVSRIIYNNRPAVIGSIIDKTHQVEEDKRIGRAVTDAQERERTQIGMELHDNVKQIMAASLMNLEFVKKNIDNKEISISTINNVRGYILEAVNELRRLSHQLTPSVDDNTGTLLEKIEKLINDSKISDKMGVILDIDEFDKPIAPEIQLAFYRILQEQFNNILKYSKASSVLIRAKRNDGKIKMTIKDDGVGFDTTLKKDGIGLENIKRRVNMINGDTKLISSLGEGCTIQISVPFN